MDIEGISPSFKAFGAVPGGLLQALTFTLFFLANASLRRFLSKSGAPSKELDRESSMPLLILALSPGPFSVSCGFYVWMVLKSSLVVAFNFLFLYAE